ncbi:MAG: nucleotidyltransferase domain-containing protein [Candidatus Hadarchaeota archaeon]|nr:nucleotidyltransferase domain-containing protein [Candidatus Hadarchaeota archaeon]
MGPKKDLTEIIRQFRRKIEGKMKIDRVILFGSRATGEVHEDSDIDLIIVSPDYEGKDFFERVSETYKYWDSHYPVDFLCYTPEEFEKLKGQVTIVREAVRTGISVEA